MLPPKPKESSSQEMQAFQNDIQEIDQWWKDSRWEHTTRTYKGTMLVAWMLEDLCLYFVFCVLCFVFVIYYMSC